MFFVNASAYSLPKTHLANVNNYYKCYASPIKINESNYFLSNHFYTDFIFV